MKLNLPYASLRTFEAVARLRGYARAAQELGVSQSAVSQHVKALEKWLGIRLVRRGGGIVVPTDLGQRLALMVGDGFGAVASLCNDLRASSGQRPALTLACPAWLAQTWLVPRLARFDAAGPALTLRTARASQGMIDDDADLTIHFGTAPIAGVPCERLMGEQVIPVCAPALLRRGLALNGPDDLTNHTLLHQRAGAEGDQVPGWPLWARQVGVPSPQGQQERYFDDPDLTLAAAVAGLGVALGRTPLVDAMLASGALIAPFGTPVATGLGYWLVFPQGAAQSARTKALADWLHTEANGRALAP